MQIADTQSLQMRIKSFATNRTTTQMNGRPSSRCKKCPLYCNPLDLVTSLPPPLRWGAVTIGSRMDLMVFQLILASEWRCFTTHLGAITLPGALVDQLLAHMWSVGIGWERHASCLNLLPCPVPDFGFGGPGSDLLKEAHGTKCLKMRCYLRAVAVDDEHDV